MFSYCCKPNKLNESFKKKKKNKNSKESNIKKLSDFPHYEENINEIKNQNFKNSHLSKFSNNQLYAKEESHNSSLTYENTYPKKKLINIRESTDVNEEFKSERECNMNIEDEIRLMLINMIELCLNSDYKKGEINFEEKLFKESLQNKNKDKQNENKMEKNKEEIKSPLKKVSKEKSENGSEFTAEMELKAINLLIK